ncbi:MAG: hypothetical protein A4E49_02103 [Methanosaeta sp. PtaU1.Bin112]|nr:MAG: hypothetical protein A4E49_02103 [Methanosaeta sp. PtaU1.Bin112]
MWLILYCRRAFSGDMARDLNERDLQILIKLVPEMEVLLKKGIEIEYMNILPPVANHHSRSVQEFEQRLKNLPLEDIRYLADLVLDGTENTGCLRPDFAEAFFVIAGQKLGESVADQLREAYESGGECGG